VPCHPKLYLLFSPRGAGAGQAAWRWSWAHSARGRAGATYPTSMLIAAQSSPKRGIGASLPAVLAIDVLREFDRDRLAEVLRGCRTRARGLRRDDGCLPASYRGHLAGPLRSGRSVLLPILSNKE